ncbi:MAG: PspC domain-containing protein [Actinomycetia bacterium]|nr:PspC domain-containing protein [Actinomycetes bacterium]
MSTTPALRRPPLVRPTDDRLLAGVARGVAEHLGVDVLIVRIAFVALTAASGAGLVVYLFLWALTPIDDGESIAVPMRTDPAVPLAAPTERPAAGTTAEPGGGPALVRGASAAAPSRSGSSIPRGAWLLAVGMLILVAGAIVALQRSGRDIGAGTLLPILLIAIGAMVAWAQLDASQRGRWSTVSGWGGWGIARLVLGIAIVVLGLLAFVTRGQSAGQLWDVALATVSVLLGTAIICAPFAVRLWSDFRREQDARVRETERADIAAHLHDGVLQTLALIQRGADDPGYVTSLARKQERELRGWLYGGAESPDQTLGGAVAAAAAEVEDLHAVAIEVVVTGDRPLDDGGRALVRAMREALLNAVRHGSPPVSAYVEIGPSAVEAFVRDHGAGFDPDAVPSDRLGVKESILGRMKRHGGSAQVRRRDPGTEVILTMPHGVAGDSHPSPAPAVEATHPNPAPAAEATHVPAATHPAPMNQGEPS